MNYRSVSDLNSTILSNLHRLPKDADVVVGVPRSGLLAASLVALALNLPLADLDGFAAGRLLASGRTRRRRALDRGFEDLRHALVVDDSIFTGGSMEAVRAKLAALGSSKKLTHCAVYGVRKTAGQVDLVFEIVPMPRVFEWNIMHHSVLGSACVDIDGVLCFDPTSDENDDGVAYLNFLQNARPLHVPTQRIGTLVTSRLEKYREQTEAWLARQGIEYDRLVMLDLPDAETRRKLGAHAVFKGKYYKNSSSPLFIESEVDQARSIVEISGKSVFCTATREMLQPGLLSPVAALKRVQHSEGLRRIARTALSAPARARLKSVLFRH